MILRAIKVLLIMTLCPIKVDKSPQDFVSGPLGNSVIYYTHKATASSIGNISSIQQPISI